MRVDNQTIQLNPSIIQTSPRGKQFRVVGLGMDLTQPPKWINGMYKHHWIVTLKFLENNRFTKLYFDSNDKLIKTEKL